MKNNLTIGYIVGFFIAVLVGITLSAWIASVITPYTNLPGRQVLYFVYPAVVYLALLLILFYHAATKKESKFGTTFAYGAGALALLYLGLFIGLYAGIDLQWIYIAFFIASIFWSFRVRRSK